MILSVSSSIEISTLSLGLYKVQISSESLEEKNWLPLLIELPVYLRFYGYLSSYLNMAYCYQYNLQNW